MCSLIKGIKVAYFFIHGPILIKSKSKGNLDIILKHPTVMNFSRLRSNRKLYKVLLVAHKSYHKTLNICCLFFLASCLGLQVQIAWQPCPFDIDVSDDLQFKVINSQQEIGNKYHLVLCIFFLQRKNDIRKNMRLCPLRIWKV